ncbi:MULTISPECIES: sensor histidine kinase [Zobellia]|uniref:Two-component system-Sensor histidine kinase n=1 Tax=Zobellia galactanivorans (strain DSM 12802 / CCUG 47099 / CIP 106680 / NCIMB 13871 / Dsij) TaxID=63186 RepID=G0L645_ZOBGA|nr:MULTISPECIES: histidine kinase [Zobellia]MBU3027670.1 histidine kinase [Zobellia galactanivorans]OWW23953.1 histidine kinase [Zobellia sp. OII3]CAZ96706.1 Two-component system-Sensor histidine kinase [Zobellia galactanivorans]
MKQAHRFLFHAILWLAVWLIAWLLIGDDSSFLEKNASSFIMQVLLIGTLIYYTAPRLLFRKKYIAFGVVSIVAIIVCSFAVTEIVRLIDGVPGPPMGGPPPGRPHMAPPQVLIQFLVLSVAYVLATFVETFLLAQKKEEETIRNKNAGLQMELKFLKSQINPHFLFNALNNIYALSVIDSNRTQESISTLSEMLRYVLYECDRPLVPIGKEISYIENYLALFALKSSKPFPITTHFDIQNSTVSIAPMLLIPFVENALKHGNIERIEGSFLEIRVSCDKRKIDFFIANSIPKNAITKDVVGGIGLENVKKRLEILYPEKHRLQIEPKAETYTVNLTIDLDEND